MFKKLLSIISLVAALSAVGSDPHLLGGRAEAKESPNAIHYVGSALLTLLNVPYKLVTCVVGQTAGGVAYVATAGVPGDFFDEGETNGPDIGEVASGSCAGAWLISPEQLQDDYRYADEYDEE